MYYTYYSFETNKGIDGLGYIGYRRLKNASNPEEENYYGTPKSIKSLEFKNNKNKNKIILGVFETKEEAIEHEIYLHQLWDVDNNEHFANAAKQTSLGFSACLYGEANPMYGKTHTPEAKKAISESRTGRFHTEETKQNISKKLSGENHPSYGTTYSDERKKAISDAAIGRVHTQETKRSMSDPTQVLWNNSKLGIDALLASPWELRQMYPELNNANLHKVYRGKVKSHKGWKIC